MTTGRFFAEKIKKLTEELQKECGPWNIKGDDRMLSELTTRASEKVEGLVKEEIKIIQESSESSDEKKLGLVKVREQIRDISWLPKSFKSSLNLQLVFAGAKII